VLKRFWITFIPGKALGADLFTAQPAACESLLPEPSFLGSFNGTRLDTAHGTPWKLLLSERRCEELQDTVRAGVVKLNVATASVQADLPFGGKASGFGSPEHGSGDAESYCRWQAVCR
jgi:hypothetical protein